MTISKRSHKAKSPPAPQPYDLQPVNPDWMYRLSDGWKYFGFAQTQLDERIRKGDIPAPISLSDAGRAKGWLGKTILDWQRKRMEAATKPRKAVRS